MGCAGAGDADRVTVDKRDTNAGPPREPKYTLRRVWLSKKEEDATTTASQRGALPLCTLPHPADLRAEDWRYYQR